jgi:hypothetical protein
MYKVHNGDYISYSKRSSPIEIHTKVKKCVDNEGDFVGKESQLCKGCTPDICKFHYNCS